MALRFAMALGALTAVIVALTFLSDGNMRAFWWTLLVIAICTVVSWVTPED